jgi:hypothetical protein
MSALFEQVAALVCAFGIVPDLMPKRDLGDFAWIIGGLGAPVAEGRSQPVTVSPSRPRARRNWASVTPGNNGTWGATVGLGIIAFNSVKAEFDSGTRCARPALVRLSGLVQTRAAKSISAQVAGGTAF